ncbi:MAG: DUF5642 family protein [Mycolicibacterium sp.]|uniref:DUF5642 family protein n=1 Tax=Mycolicibacterium sp. TaxID=2320850 RepID=UPI003D15294F
MRQFAACSLALLCSACGQHDGPAPHSLSTESTGTQINPARIDRTRGELPPGYEVSVATTVATPLASWSLGEASVAVPPKCLILAAPAVGAPSARGWSASGPGGIVFAVVAESDGAAPDSRLLAECGRWTLTSERSTATVIVASEHTVPGAPTMSMSATITTVVEGGTETRSRADTFAAYLVGYLCFVTLVTDPGSPGPSLQPGFAADLLLSVVSALRG